eukprot:TRINITY_DN27872_c0_g1_i1.p1 TRINITY_DN27872_c0_g1~~TRINITY_DN27872_c0_g1_i1.p1  ORF type:complete len:457 (+),score=118.48 TRINITY_DN27872_c0_g1_i1:74-1444(+)
MADYMTDPTQTPYDEGYVLSGGLSSGMGPTMAASAWHSPSAFSAGSFPGSAASQPHANPRQHVHQRAAPHSQAHFLPASVAGSARYRQRGTPSVMTPALQLSQSQSQGFGTITPPYFPGSCEARSRRSVSPVGRGASASVAPTEGDEPLMIEAPPSRRGSGRVWMWLLVLVLIGLVVGAATVERGPKWLPCWAREVVHGRFDDFPSKTEQQHLEGAGVSRCDFYDDVRMIHAEIVRLLARAYAKNGQDGLPTETLRLDTKKTFYLQDAPPGGVRPHTPYRFFFVVFNQALATSPYITTARSQAFVAIYPSPSLLSTAAYWFDQETQALLLSQLFWSGACWGFAMVLVVVYLAERWRARSAAKKRLHDDTALLLSTAYEGLRRNGKRGQACSMAELRRFCIGHLRGRVSSKQIRSLWPAPGEGPEGPVEVHLRGDPDCDVRPTSSTDPTMLISLRGY